ncbi:MAG TPA: hypothetical protein VJK05_04290 [archaeon]|nr:hypothetical protein [archaeon]
MKAKISFLLIVLFAGSAFAQLFDSFIDQGFIKNYNFELTVLLAAISLAAGIVFYYSIKYTGYIPKSESLVTNKKTKEFLSLIVFLLPLAFTQFSSLLTAYLVLAVLLIASIIIFFTIGRKARKEIESIAVKPLKEGSVAAFNESTQMALDESLSKESIKKVADLDQQIALQKKRINELENLISLKTKQKIELMKLKPDLAEEQFFSTPEKALKKEEDEKKFEEFRSRQIRRAEEKGAFKEEK